MFLNRLETLCLLLLAFSIAPLSAADPAAGGAIWIDVRAPSEYEQKHVSFAMNIPHTEIVQGVAALELPKDQPIYVYCGSGRRAGIARESLIEAGYENVKNIGNLDTAQVRAGEAGDD